MIANPYQILGISPNASNDEIKRAYRELSRKYHPDSYVDNPLADLAEEKFKEVQEAYDQIMKERGNGYGGVGSSGYGNAGSGSTSYSNTGSAGSGYDAPELNTAAGYINSGRYREALDILTRVPFKSARWYYYSAVANAGAGNNIVALEQARQAVNMEPGNQEYRSFLNQIEWQGQRYQSTRYNNTGHGGLSRGYGTGNLCCDLWCADSLCECMGGDLISCC